jgi:ferredoxin
VALEIQIDQGDCRGAGECVHRAPETFSLDPDERSEVANPTGNPEEQILAAARACPHFAIRVYRGGDRIV